MMIMNALRRRGAAATYRPLSLTSSSSGVLQRQQRRNFLMPTDSLLWFAYKVKDRADTPPPGVDPLYWENRLLMRWRGPKYYGPMGSLRWAWAYTTSAAPNLAFVGTWVGFIVWFALQSEDDPEVRQKRYEESTCYNLRNIKELQRHRVLKERGGHGDGVSWAAH